MRRQATHRHAPRVSRLVAPLAAGVAAALVLLLGCETQPEGSGGDGGDGGGRHADDAPPAATDGPNGRDGAGASAVPNVPDAATARAWLAELTTAAEGPMTGYERDLFPHWSEEDGCSTRETVLARDGDDVAADDDCRPTSGTWYSPYDGVTLDDPGEVDIDHVVPLAEAWRSGAAEWTTEERAAFANDLDHPQLVAVSATANRSKGDQDPADWQPPEADFGCEYARMWIGAKHAWQLTVDTNERTALETLLDTC